MSPRLLLFSLPFTALFLSMGQPVHAGDNNPSSNRDRQPVLVELFTSEGCSSCPPADALLASLDREQNVPGATAIVLSEHVDYWNDLGWHDPFSSSAITARQNAYAARLGQDSVYTPEAVVDGERGMTGSDRRAVIGAIEDAAERPKAAIQLSGASRSGLSVEAHVSVAALKRADIYAVVADDRDQSNVGRGENSGRQLDHVAVVRVLEKVGSLDQGFDQKIQITLPGNRPAQQSMRLVIFAQDRVTGRVVGVAETGV